MDHPLIHDRGRGPELVGTRVTIYNLVADFFDPARTEQAIAADYRLKADQVAAMRAYLVRNFADVMAANARIDERLRAAREAQQNDPAFQAMVADTRRNFELFKEWVTERKAAGLPVPHKPGDPGPSFRDWLAGRLGAVAAAG